MTDPTISLDHATLRTLVATCHGIARAKGFHETGAPHGARIDQMLMLCVGELAEAQEELRSGHTPTEIYFTGAAGDWKPTAQELAEQGFKPEGFPIELADAVIRIFDLAGALGIDLQDAVQTKLAYNLTRPHKHGRSF